MRHMMLRRTFFAVLLLLLFLTLSHATERARGEDGQPKEHTLLSDGKTDMFISKKSAELENEYNVKIESFRSPALIKEGKMIVIVAEAHYTSESKKYVGILSVTLRKGGALGEISAVLRDSYEKVDFSSMLRPTVIGDEEDIAAFFGAYCGDVQPLEGKSTLILDKNSAFSGGCWMPRMLTGNFEGKIIKTEKYFDWRDPETATNIFKKGDVSQHFNFKDMSIKEFIGSGGAGIQTKNDKLIVPVQALLKNESIVSLIITSSHIMYDWEFSKGTSDIDCINPAVLEFEDKQLLMITSCKSGHYKVYESTDGGEKWTAFETLSGVWGTNKQRNGSEFRGGFITADIDNTRVILFTQPVQATDGSSKYSLHLWMTDLTHIYDVGRISAEDENVSASSLLYKNDDEVEVEGEGKKEFYCAYEVNNGGDKFDIVVVDLKDKLEEIKKTLQTWNEVNDKVAKRYCYSAQTKSDSGAAPCKFVKGLVGLLSDKSKNKDWEDEYSCVNATLPQNADSAAGGFKFVGPGEGAKWPAKSDGQNQPYHFANNAFTLVATVTIDTKPTADTVPLLGVVFRDAENEKRYGLSYTSDNQWSVTNDKEENLHKNRLWKTETPYQVAISMKDREFYVYVNGESIDKENIDSTLIIEDAGIFSHFYFGAHGKEESAAVTVKDVLLYNRLLDKYEIEELKKTTIFVKAEVVNGIQEARDPQPAPPAPPVSSPNSPVKGQEPDDSPQPEKQTLETDKNGSLESSQKQKKVIVDSSPTPAKEPEIVLEVKDVVTHHSDASPELNEVDSPTEPADAARRPDGVESQITGALTTHDISGENTVPVGDEDDDKNKTGDENTSNSEPNKVTKEEEEPAEATPTLQAKEAKKEEATTAPNATVPEAAGSESPAADNTSLRGTTNASNHNDTLRTLLEMTKGGDGAVRSCVSLLALLPSLCLWCFLTALHCCQAIAA